MPDDDARVFAPLSAQEEDLLRALARALVFVPRALESDIGSKYDLSMSELFALMHLSDAAAGSLRMGDLAARSALTLGAVTRVVKLLERKGLVERRPSPSDGRGHEAVLTAAGHDRLEAVRPAQVASARRRVLDKLDGVDLRAATAMLSVLSQDDGAGRPTP